ncbi:MAG TPA: tRNA (N(6)-L-threonylcarbamoyladenosine(37)-C(2))-methylthiotransferase MtaB [Terriglobales bacterium]|nr:tRNA (N(6)-L-threonylcarbamoyladenosine(37)-C(2))-methylthiotransferase MtaB [Terriglobales bacterium]
MTAVAIATLGCRLNQVDSADLALRLAERGLGTVDADARADASTPADVVVVNTCTVTARADASNRAVIRRLARRHPGAPIVVTGCWAQTSPRAVAALGVDAVVGNDAKLALPDVVLDLARRRRAARVVEPAAPALAVPSTAQAEVGGGPESTSDVGIAPWDMAAPARPLVAERARAFLKVQDGCAHRCAFCIVPFARGVSRSLDPSVVLEQARYLVALGYREIVLTGVDLGAYGRDLAVRTNLASLVRELVGIRGLRWVRLSSVLPAYFTDELIDVIAGSERVAPHFHIPLQSGSDSVLRAMKRPYDTRMYRALVERLAGAVPGLGLGADLIVGFPGESDADFQATMALVGALPFSYLHVFGYSERAGTAAALRPGRVPAATITRRSAAVRALGDSKGRAFRQALRGSLQDVVVLEHRDRRTGSLVGLTGNYVEVRFDGTDALTKTVARVRVTGVDASGAFGALVTA